MEKKRIKKVVLGVGRDLLLAFIVVIIVMAILFAYCKIWPPMVVVESGSMQHSDTRSFIGVIDTGDMVFVKKVEGSDELLTYVEGEATEYSTYGDFGDVVIYQPNGDKNRTPIIHRLVVWVEINRPHASSTNGETINFDDYTFNVPSLGIYDSIDNVVLHDYGYDKRDVTINLTMLRDNFRSESSVHDGFITLGDHNCGRYDQYSYELVKTEWIIGKSIGELPWFGLIKLSVTKSPGNVGAAANSWINLIALIMVVIFVPLFFDFGFPWIKKRMRKRKGGVGVEQRDGGDDDVKPIAKGPVEVARPQPVIKETIIKEKEIIREIVRLPCKYCGTLVNQIEIKCPNCGGNLK